MSKTKIKIRHLEDLDTIHIIYVNHDWYKFKTKKKTGLGNYFLKIAQNLHNELVFVLFGSTTTKKSKLKKTRFTLKISSLKILSFYSPEKKV
jgi:hypothetical protein